MMDYSTILILITVGLVTIYRFFVKKNYFEKHGIPHAKSISFIWSTIDILLFRRTSFRDQINNLYNMHQDAKYIGVYHSAVPTIMIRDLDLLKEITIKKFVHFTDHNIPVEPGEEIIARKNLFSLRGDEWRKTRNNFSPAFTLSKLRSMFELMSECAERFTNTLQIQQVDEVLQYDSQDIFKRYTNDALATCAFGVAVNSMKNPNNEFFLSGKKATDLGGIKGFKIFIVRFFPILKKCLRFKTIDTKIENFFLDVIRETITNRGEEGMTRPDIIQSMLEVKNIKDISNLPDLNIENITSQAYVTYFGGFETVSLLICFITYHLSMSLDVQEKLQEEIDKVMESNDCKPTYEAVNNLEYLDAIIRETLRLYPMNTIMDRVCTKHFELPPALPGGKSVMLKPGDTIWYPIASFHRDPKYFPHPDNFYPERFIGDARADNNFNAYLPFGLGPRICVGNRFASLETKVLLVHLLSKFDISLGSKMSLPMKMSNKTFTYTADGGFWVNLKPRRKK